MGITHRSVWVADMFLRYGTAPIPQTGHPYIQFDKLEFNASIPLSIPFLPYYHLHFQIGC